MATKLTPYLNFNGNARDAMTFYAAVLNGELEIAEFGAYGSTGDAEQDKKVMHACVTTDSGLTLMASDNPPGMESPAPAGFSVSLSGDDDATLRGYWEKLAAVGNVQLPLEKQVWGDVFGHLVDQFGVSWMVNIGNGEQA